ncbi:MAG: ABC transporter permease [Oscillospiraceae bacterium]|nr:ABC transporter permease [Oscillospiraceae bacterium]
MRLNHKEVSRRKIKISEHGVVIGFVLLCVCVGLLTPAFFTPLNILNLLRQSSIVGIIAIGMTGVILSGNFDVSVGGIAATTGAVCMWLLARGFPLPVALLCALITGLAAGAVNGVVVAKLGVPSLIATMGMRTLLTGAILMVTGGFPISGSRTGVFGLIGNGHVFRIPFPVIIFILITLGMFFFLQYTKHGRYVYSVGGNEESSRLCGIKTDRIKIMVFAISGLLSSLAGVVLISRLGTASPVAGDGYDMDAIAAVVIGGTSVLGGEGSALKTVIGVLFMSVINNAFNLLGIDMFIQYVVKGLIIIVAVGASSYSRKKAMGA